jgi:hypothetical protein
MTTSTSRIAKLTESIVNATDKRWCASHRGEAAANAGSYVISSKTKRWICDRCQAKSEQRKMEIRANAALVR